ncbi:6216_t:CDS:2 [Entrophospora sp. SA101]|nr:6216_t:CDS:2 [Entrophospora sp. SA101]
MPPPHLILAESVEIIDDSKNDTESIDIKHGEEEIRRLSLIDVLSTIKAINKEPTGDNNIHITSVQNTPAKKRNDKNQPLPSSSKSPSPGSPLQRSDLFSYLE